MPGSKQYQHLTINISPQHPEGRPLNELLREILLQQARQTDGEQTAYMQWQSAHKEPDPTADTPAHREA